MFVFMSCALFRIMKSSLQEHVGQLDAFGSVNHSGHQVISPFNRFQPPTSDK